MRPVAVASTISAVLVLVLTGCSFHNPVEDALRRSLDETAKDSATVDFDTIVEGDWTTLVLICDGATADQVEDTLGFPWGAPDSDGTFHSRFVFASGSGVEASFDSGDTTASKLPWVYPCPPRSVYNGLNPVVNVPRSASDLQFVVDRTSFGRPVWFVPRDEFERLSRN